MSGLIGHRSAHSAAAARPLDNFPYEFAARWGLRQPASAQSGTLCRPVGAARWHVLGNRGSPHLIGDPLASLDPSHSARGACLGPSTLLGISSSSRARTLVSLGTVTAFTC